ncbi:hypothetical protein TRIP_B50153 [uncultured Desulfatiglans sp.]|uniref:Uncharacterized protein n=1 Tax=Uncultured Desulfatiglans sp. TaxID=1748965 RepID=A0A653AGE8_UNCDX|nr:hypothetical protein TRIP_B50153 [uncultured Desulfatiglans sp.]
MGHRKERVKNGTMASLFRSKGTICSWVELIERRERLHAPRPLEISVPGLLFCPPGG